MLLYIFLLLWLLSQECLQFMWTVLQLQLAAVHPTPISLDPTLLPSLMSIFKSQNSFILLYGFPTSKRERERERCRRGKLSLI